MILNCPYLVEQVRVFCYARREGVIVPTLSEKALYCLNGNYSQCPVFKSLKQEEPEKLSSGEELNR